MKNELTASEILKQLGSLASASYKKTLTRHGIQEPVLGVSIAELKKFQKKIKCDHDLACELFDAGVYEAQYLAGLIADASRMTKSRLRQWLAHGNCPVLCGTIVAWVAAESEHGYELALQWIDSKDENTAQTGWQTLASVAAITEDAELKLPEWKRLLKRVEQTIHREANHVRYAMNDFVIAVGTHVAELTTPALQTADKMGTVSVDMGDTACEVPSAREHIQKAQQRGAIGKKRKSAKC
jgi:3-methyladenine DNA glycosylase AlkD